MFSGWSDAHLGLLHLLFALSLLFIQHGMNWMSGLLMGVACHLDLSYAPIILSMAAITAYPTDGNSTRKPSLIGLLLCFIVSSGLLAWMGIQAMGNINVYLNAMLKHHLPHQQLQPGLGLRWYLNAEVMEPFRLPLDLLFEAAQYVMPAVVVWIFRGRNAFTLMARQQQQQLALFLVLAMTFLFKAAPTMQDLVICLSFLPRLSPIIKHSTRVRFCLLAMTISMVLAACFHGTWLDSAHTNVNYFYFAILGVSISMMMLVIDLVKAEKRSRHAKGNGEEDVKKTSNRLYKQLQDPFKQ